MFSNYHFCLSLCFHDPDPIHRQPKQTLYPWKFYIGGYPHAEKWFKDCTFEFDDMQPYQKIIVALTETAHAGD